MGRSEEKSKRRPSPSISEDEGKRKKHRSRDDRETKNEKKKKKSHRDKDKEKSKKSHKHSKNHDDKEKRHRKHSKNVGEGFKEISNDDYFSKNNEFSTWLKDEKGVFFSDLTSEDARKLFSDFVKDWNSKKLESRYYEGITSGPRTAHNWKILNQKD